MLIRFGLHYKIAEKIAIFISARLESAGDFISSLYDAERVVFMVWWALKCRIKYMCMFIILHFDL